MRVVDRDTKTVERDAEKERTGERDTEKIRESWRDWRELTEEQLGRERVEMRTKRE